MTPVEYFHLLRIFIVLVFGVKSKVRMELYLFSDCAQDNKMTIFPHKRSVLFFQAKQSLQTSKMSYFRGKPQL